MNMLQYEALQYEALQYEAYLAERSEDSLTV